MSRHRLAGALLQKFEWDKKSEALTFAVGENVPVHIHWTFAVPIVLPFVFEWPERPLDALAHTTIMAVLLFSAVFLHELAHMWAARSQGVAAKRIELYLFGGLIHFSATEERQISWVWIIFAGPLVNIVLGLFCLAGYFAATGSIDQLPYDHRFSIPPPRPFGLFEWTCWLGAILNLALAFLNLLPAFPLDGGVIAKELLRPRVGPQRATRIVGICGLFVSVLRIPIILAAAAGVLVWLPPPFKPNWKAASGSKKAKPRSRAAKWTETDTVAGQGRMANPQIVAKS